jgi:hypothetical protein
MSEPGLLEIRIMPSRQTLRRARRDKREGKASTTQAGEFIREEMHHIREGKHGARSPRQAIAIGLSKARRAGVELKPPAAGRASGETRTRARRDYARGHGAPPAHTASSARRAATRRALKREGNSAASPHALAEQAHRAAGPTQQGAALGSCETSGADEGSGTAIRSRKKGSKNPRHALAQTRAAGAFCSSASSGLAAAPLRFNPLQTR